MVMSVGAATFKTFVFRPSGVRGGRLLSLVLCCLLSYYPTYLSFGGGLRFVSFYGGRAVRRLLCVLCAVRAGSAAKNLGHL